MLTRVRSLICLVGIVALAVLWGCGFQLRGWDLATSVGSAAVVSEQRAAIVREVERSLQASGVELRELADQPQVIVRILDERVSRRSASVSGQARVAEYELTSVVDYAIEAADGPLLGKTSATAQRSFRLDRDNIVASNEEQSLLEREMQRDLVEQILRSLNRVTESEEGGDAAASG